MADITHSGPDKRASTRFPLSEEVFFKIYEEGNLSGKGVGTSLNMSSRGILFQTEQPMPQGRRVEVAVNWPAELDHKCPLKLVASGRVVRSQAGIVAVKIDRYEFRTRGTRKG